MNLYLSRLILNPRSKQVMSEMAQPYEMHRTLMRAFPSNNDGTPSNARDEFGVLFRADVEDLQCVIKVYVQSRIEPDWSFLKGQGYLYSDAKLPEFEYKDIMPAYRKLQNGQLLSFRLRANPTKRIARENDPMKGKRVELSREDEQLNWLIRKGRLVEGGVAGGFDLYMKKAKGVNAEDRPIPCVKISCEGKRTGRKKDAVHGHSTTHFAVLFEGLLRVTDKNAFLQTLVSGIGSGKAFGFGLLSVAPVHPSISE